MRRQPCAAALSAWPRLSWTADGTLPVELGKGEDWLPLLSCNVSIFPGRLMRSETVQGWRMAGGF